MTFAEKDVVEPPFGAKNKHGETVEIGHVQELVNVVGFDPVPEMYEQYGKELLKKKRYFDTRKIHTCKGQEVQNSQNVALQEKFHGRILKGARTISDTLQNNGMQFLQCRAK